LRRAARSSARLRATSRISCARSPLAGTLLLYLRHTSASLVIQEKADPDVQDDLMTALARLAPEHAGWVHDTEGSDDMPAHIKAMLNGISLNVPVTSGKAALGT
jgi:secondary thiamine-phosphate synthase enzyme